MATHPRPRLALGLLFLAAACGDDPSLPPEGLFELAVLEPGADAALDFFALPYPNDLRVDADGTPALARFPRTDPVLGGFVDAIDATGRGFGASQAVYVRFGAALDPSTLPDEAGSLAAGASVFLVDVTPQSSHRGERLPVRLRYSAPPIDFIGAHWLALQPVPGLTPREGATYAVVITDGVRGPGGAARPSPALARVLAGAPEGALEARAAEVYAPLRAWLDEHRELAGHVAQASVYTTSVGTTTMDALRVAVHATPAPQLSELAFVRSAPGYSLYTGKYDSPNFQEGEVPYATSGGQIHRGSDGKPAPVRTESLRVAITVPEGPMPAGGWPVVLYAHGTGGSYLSFVSDGTASRLSVVQDRNRAELTRFAVVSIDQVLHVPRVPQGTDPELSFFNFNNIVAARDNIKQGALDDFQLLRLVKAIDTTLPNTAAALRFDASRIYFFGHSQGSLTGALFVAAEPEVKAVVFSGGGAGLVAALLEKTKPIDIASLVQSFFRDPVDDFHPMLNLLQGYFDESDPGSYARRYFLEPAAGMAPKNVFISLGLRDSYTPVTTIASFALGTGVVPVRPELSPLPDLPLTGLSWKDAPQAGNVAGGQATGVLRQYDPGAGDGHFVVFQVPAAAAQSTRFLGSHAATGVAQLDAP